MTIYLAVDKNGRLVKVIDDYNEAAKCRFQLYAIEAMPSQRCLLDGVPAAGYGFIKKD